MQVRFGGITASDTRDAPLLVTELDLGGLSVRNADSINLNAHGTTAGRDFFSDNAVRFALWSNRNNYQQGVRELNVFLNAWREAIASSETGQLIPLDYRHDNDGPWQTIFGSPDFSSNTQIDEAAHHGYSMADFEFRQHLPLTYGPERSVTLEDGDYVNFTLSSGPVKPVVIFNGPFENPVLTIGDMRIGLRGSAASNDYWIVDPFSRTITDRYGRNSPARADRRTVLSRISASPTGHEVSLTSAPFVELSWRPSAYNKYEGGTLVEYRWLGEPHNSESVKLVDGVEVARNLIQNPSFEEGSTGVTRSNAEIELVPKGDLFPWLDSGKQVIKVTSIDSETSFYIGQNYWSAQAGKWYAFRATVSTSETSMDMRTFIQFRQEGSTLDNSTLENIQVTPEGREMVFAAQAPEGTDRILALIWPKGYEGFFLADGMMLGEGDTEAEAYAQVREYFDGDTPDYIIREES